MFLTESAHDASFLDLKGILLLTLFLLAIAIGWALGYKFARKRSNQPSDESYPFLQRDYFIGLNYLINEQPDQATDVLIKMLEVNSETVEAHLALGHLFRRKGEVERAIRLHQNVIARPSLTQEQRLDALLALAIDYQKAGLLDRAERILVDVRNEGSLQHRKASLERLLDIYQQEKEWNKAIETANTLQKLTGGSYFSVISHHYCELAEESFEAGHEAEAMRHAQQASRSDKNNVRASLLLAKFLHAKGRLKESAKLYKASVYQDAAYLPEVLEPLKHLYTSLNQPKEYHAFLDEMTKEFLSSTLVLEKTRSLLESSGPEIAIEFLVTRLKHKPTLKGLKALISIQADRAPEDFSEQFRVLQNFIQSLIEKNPVYQCGHCGLSGKTLHWLCPQCKSWGKTKPIQGLEGE